MFTRSMIDQYRIESFDYASVMDEGIKALNEYWSREAVGEDWRDMIDVDSLDMSNIKCCVLGQLFGEFFIAPECLAQLVAFWPPGAMMAEANKAWRNYLRGWHSMREAMLNE